MRQYFRQMRQNFIQYTYTLGKHQEVHDKQIHIMRTFRKNSTISN